MRLKKRLAAALAVMLVGATSVAPAFAHDGHWIYVTGGKAMFESGSQWLDYCDTAYDGNYVVVHLKTPDGTIFKSGQAPSGGCGREGETGTSFQQFRVCTSNIGCSAWHNRY